MDVLIVGGGGREHALSWKIAQSPECDRLFVAPGNGGTAEIAENIPIDSDNIDGLQAFAKQNQIGLTVVGPEKPLELGIVDRFESESLPIFGPTQAAARVETSKVFAKNIMNERAIPTAQYQAFDVFKDAIKHARERTFPLWVKADGTAEGKGAEKCENVDQAEKSIENMMVHGKYGAAGRLVIIEDHVEGPEVSLHAISDGKTYLMLPSSQDHKTFYEGGPNTGGVAAIAPHPKVGKSRGQKYGELVVAPLLNAMRQAGTPYKGVLYPDVKLSDDGPKVIEYNARFGDPEMQVLARLLKSDLLELLMAATEGRLDSVQPRWNGGFAACAVLVSGGYPGEYNRGLPIGGINNAEALQEVELFHAGTVKDEGLSLYKTDGGRVLGATAVGKTLHTTLGRTYEAAKRIGHESFSNSKYGRKFG